MGDSDDLVVTNQGQDQEWNFQPPATQQCLSTLITQIPWWLASHLVKPSVDIINVCQGIIISGPPPATDEQKRSCEMKVLSRGYR